MHFIIFTSAVYVKKNHYYSTIKIKTIIKYILKFVFFFFQKKNYTRSLLICINKLNYWWSVILQKGCNNFCRHIFLSVSFSSFCFSFSRKKNDNSLQKLCLAAFYSKECSSPSFCFVVLLLHPVSYTHLTLPTIYSV